MLQLAQPDRWMVDGVFPKVTVNPARLVLVSYNSAANMAFASASAVDEKYMIKQDRSSATICSLATYCFDPDPSPGLESALTKEQHLTRDIGCSESGLLRCSSSSTGLCDTRGPHLFIHNG